MNTGEHVWMQPIGDTPDNIKNHERLKGVTIPRTGRGGRLGIMLTKTLLFAGERGPLVTGERTAGLVVPFVRQSDRNIVSETLLRPILPACR
jgi:quinoprotein glucose dehydrogenase